VRNPEAERFVREVWAVFQREGFPACSRSPRRRALGAAFRASVGRADPVVAREAFIALHRDAEDL
jgi:hypothetical protein